MDFGLIVDVETTGLDPTQDKIIEIGLVGFLYDGENPPVITATYGGLEDPEEPLKPEIVALTGLNDQVLAGQSIDWALVRQLMSRAAVVIAHNAAFDSGFLKRRPELNDLSLHWACSVDHIAWAEHGYRTRALNYLAADQGFVNPFPHRAVFDCATTFRVISNYMSELIKNSYERKFRINAVGSPFESKDVLRLRGYRWDNEQRFWFKEVLESALSEEREFLNREVYKGRSRHEEIAVASLDDAL